MTRKLVLYGAGKRCKALCMILQKFDVDIIAIIDSNPDKWGSEIEGYQIEPPERLRQLQNVDLCITVLDSYVANAIRKELQQEYGYKPEREINYNKLILEVYKESSEIREKILNKSVNSSKEETLLVSCINGLGVLGGVQAWTISICEAFIKNGRENTYIISSKGKYDVPPMLKDHMEYVDINLQERFSMTSVLSVIEVIMKKLPCKIITTYTDEIMLAAYLVKCYYPEMVEIIATIRNSNENIYEMYMGFRECPDLYIGVSQDIRSDMIQKGIEPEKVYAMSVPFACEKTLIRTYTEDSTLPIHIGYAGRMGGMERFQKRMDLMLKLMLMLKEKRINFMMELAGEGAVRQEMEEFVRLNHLDEKVKFLGRLTREEMACFWKRQDICVNLADYEGRSISIIEAMGNGAVPVVTATSGVREDITDNVNGYIVPLGDYHTMANRIEYLAEHRERLNEMGKLAHDAVYPKSLMESHLKFWEDILSRKLR